MKSAKPKITVEYEDDATIVGFTEDKILEEAEIQRLQDAIGSLIEQTEKIKLVLDFKNVSFLSSAVLGLLIRLSKRVYEKDGRLKLCNIEPRIYEIFKITRLTKVFDIYKDLQSTTAALKEGK